METVFANKGTNRGITPCELWFACEKYRYTEVRSGNMSRFVAYIWFLLMEISR